MSFPHLHHDFAQRLPELGIPRHVQETPAPRLCFLNEPLARDLGLDPDWLRTETGLRFLTGQQLPETARPVAMAYAGHQFGGYSPLLGDGRALLLGELAVPGPEDSEDDGAEDDGAGGVVRPTPAQLRDLHLKGSGTTPFTRPGADGQAVLAPMLREALIGESLHALGIPSTRALAVVSTGRPVIRERPLPGAVLVRVAASHLRVGTFQLARQVGVQEPSEAGSADWPVLRRLTDCALQRHFPETLPAENPACALFEQVVAVQARLVAQWMLVGFVHGVMNTDNMAISGQSLDFGPCAFIDAYSADAVFSSIDRQGRYRLGNQPAAAQWGLARFGEALLPLLASDPQEAAASAEGALAGFSREYDAAWQLGLARKLGLAPGEHAPRAEVVALGERLLELMAARSADWTSLFRRLGRVLSEDAAEAAQVRRELAEEGFDSWVRDWLSHAPDRAQMDAVNPVVIPRNHLVEEALAAAHTGELGLFEALMARLRDPFAEGISGRVESRRYAEPAPAEAGPYVTWCGT